jgi:3-oxoacyl-[acyl-carrier protein] reductase
VSAAIVVGAVAATRIAAGLAERGVDAQVVPAGGSWEAAPAATDFVWAADPPQASPTDIADLSTLQWSQAAEVPMREFFQRCQAISAALAAGAGRPARPGRVVLVVPSLALAGAPGLVAWATAAEGQRSLAKALARAWGRRGITVNTVAVPVAVLQGPAGDGTPLDRPGLQPLSLPALPTLQGEVAGVIAGLLQPEWGAVTGATIAVDGGQWMPS